MTPHGFSHFYEIFATFTLTYIIVDELTGNPFVSAITEKVLKKYSSIHHLHSQLKQKIKTQSISFDAIQQQLSNYQDGEKVKTQKDLNEVLQSFEGIKDRIDTFYKEIKIQISQNYTTKIFEHLNCYLLLYCLTMIYYGGLYNGLVPENDTNTHFLKSLDNSLLVFCTGAISFLIFGWISDTTKKANGNSYLKNEYPTGENFAVRHGYKIAGIWYLVFGILAICFYYFRWEPLNYLQTSKDLLMKAKSHQLLILCSVFIPLSNFIVYLLKANMRANKLLPILKTRCEANQTTFLESFEKTEAFIGHCGWLNQQSVSLQYENKLPEQ